MQVYKFGFDEPAMSIAADFQVLGAQDLELFTLWIWGSGDLLHCRIRVAGGPALWAVGELMLSNPCGFGAPGARGFEALESSWSAESE